MRSDQSLTGNIKISEIVVGFMKRAKSTFKRMVPKSAPSDNARAVPTFRGKIGLKGISGVIVAVPPGPLKSGGVVVPPPPPVGPSSVGPPGSMGIHIPSEFKKWPSGIEDCSSGRLGQRSTV